MSAVQPPKKKYTPKLDFERKIGVVNAMIQLTTYIHDISSVSYHILFYPKKPKKGGKRTKTKLIHTQLALKLKSPAVLFVFAV